MTTRVLIVDDQHLVRAGLNMLLSAHDDLTVVGEADSGARAVELARRHRPDVVLMDLRMPGMDGIEATTLITHDTDADPDQLVRVLVLTTFEDETLMHRALRAGASGYVLKYAAPAEVVAAVRRVAGGDAWIDPSMAPRVIEALRALATATPGSDATRVLDVLTPREKEVLRLVALGMSNREITDRFVLSEATVKTHVARILMKTGSRDRAAVVALAYQSGFVAPGDTA